MPDDTDLPDHPKIRRSNQKAGGVEVGAVAVVGVEAASIPGKSAGLVARRAAIADEHFRRAIPRIQNRGAKAR